MKIIGVIPARAASKTIPHKNIKLLGGKPLIYYSIRSALRSNLLDRVIVSTDGRDIAGIGKRYGAEVIKRPNRFATDKAPTELALTHVVEWLEKKENYKADAVLTLEPTSPFRSSKTIDRCVRLLMQKGVDSVMTVVETSSLVGKMNGQKFSYLVPNQPRRRQDRKPLFKESSTVYGTRTQTLFREKSVLGRNLKTVAIDEMEAIDINTPFDFFFAECVMRWKKGGSKA